MSLSIKAGQSVAVSAENLENGSPTFHGRLGDGSGKWQLFITSTAEIVVMSLLESPTEHLANVSRGG